MFWFYPIIRRYDIDGNFLEEIRFTSKTLMKELEESESFRKTHNASIGGIHILRKPFIMPDNELLLNVTTCGNIALQMMKPTHSCLKNTRYSVLSGYSIKAWLNSIK